MGECCICRNIYKDLAPEEGFVNYLCDRCGIVKCTAEFYRIMFSAVALTGDQKANACGWIRENPGYLLDIRDVESIQNIQTPTVEEKANKLLLHIIKLWSRPGQSFQIKDGPEILGITWSATINEFHFILWTFLRDDKNLIKLVDGNHVITPAGWAHIAKLQAPNSESNIAFVAMRFSDPILEIYSSAIRAAIETCGYEPKIMTEHDHIKKIDDEIIALIKKSRFIIADFTEQNQGAYYEAGYARGLGLPVISTCNKKEVDEGKLHFDTRQYRTILWEKDNLDVFVKELQNCIEANIGRGKIKPGMEKQA